jgi:hypothetical protein
MRMYTRCVCILICSGLLGLTQVGQSGQSVLGVQIVQVVQAESLDSSLAAQTQADQESLRAQKKIDTLADETAQMLQEYRDASRQVESLRTYTAQLERLVDSQQQDVTSLETQLQDIEVTQREIVPLLIRMVDGLEQFIALDMPFLAEERRVRLERLQEMMDQADVTIAEKYRRIMEAYQVETEYGRTIEAYRGAVQMPGQNEQNEQNKQERTQERTVDMLRIGRVALLYLSLDRNESGQWNRTTKEWEVLPNTYRRSIARGLQIAKKQAAPQLISIPVPAPHKEVEP